MAEYPRSAEMLRRLVSIDTTSRNSNLELIDFVRDHLDRFGIASELVLDATGKKANLYATIGPDDRPGICLSGHTDVVPIDGQDWSTDPWVVTEKDGLLYGRGTSDMKGFLAIALTWVEPNNLSVARATTNPSTCAGSGCGAVPSGGAGGFSAAATGNYPRCF